MESDCLFSIAVRRNLTLPLAGGDRVPTSALEIEALLASTTPAWHRFDVVNDILGGDAASIAFAAAAFVERQRTSEVRYTEVRYDPVRLEHSAYAPAGPRLSSDAVVAAVAPGLRNGMIARADGIVVNQLLCAMRGSTPAQCTAVVELAARSHSVEGPGGVVGLDLAGDELHYDNSDYLACFSDARRRLNLSTTAHVGEGFGNLPLESHDMLTALVSMGVNRIGHGYARAM